MKLKNLIYIVLMLSSIAFISCSKLADGITENKAPTIHPVGWGTVGSANFHAAAFNDTSVTLKFCKSCHANDYSGGLAKVSCNTCHVNELPHRVGWGDVTSTSFHSTFFKDNNWNLKLCKACHAQNYTGGIAKVTCKSCHVSNEGPEACNTCHGAFNNGNYTDSTRIAPPRAVLSSDGSVVGAHVSHLYENDLTSNVTCVQCHVVPGNVEDPGHIVPGASHATLTFGALAKKDGAEPNYNFGTKTCSDVYCHGNFVFLKDTSTSANSYIFTADSIVGNKFNPVWNKLDDTQAECGTCHGLPPKGHDDFGGAITVKQCGLCHSAVVDGQGNIIDKAKHINGVINVFGN